MVLNPQISTTKQLNYHFWTGEPELDRIKRQYYTCVDKSESKHKEACKTIASGINLTFPVANFTKPKGLCENCLLSYCTDNFGIIKGLARFKKQKTFIYIDDLTGFAGGGNSLLYYIIRQGLLMYKYDYVEIVAASRDKKLADYYKEIGESILGVQAEIYDVNHVKFTRE